MINAYLKNVARRSAFCAFIIIDVSCHLATLHGGRTRESFVTAAISANKQQNTPAAFS